jgi:poly(beta-D-mannuronate) C5 epimerase
VSEVRDKASGKSDGGEVSTVPIELVLSQVSLQTGSNHHIELKEAQRWDGKPALVVRTGRWTLDALAARLEKDGLDGYLVPVEGGYRSNLPIAIWRKASLRLGETDRLELSTESGAFLLNAGLLHMEGAALSGSAESNRVEDFRPFLVTALGGRTLIEASSLSDLGFGDRPHMRGVSFVSSPFFPAQTKALVRNSRFNRVHSIELAEMYGGRIEGNLIAGATGSGIRMKSAADVELLSNMIVGSAQHGVSLSSGTSNVLISGNVLAFNSRAGLFANGGVSGSRIEHNLISSNLKSGILLSGNGCVDLSANLIARNALWGAAAKKSFKLSFTDNTFLLNQGPGLTLETSVFPNDTKRVAGNRFVANQSGIEGEHYAELELTGNDFSSQMPILFAGELETHTPQYLSWAQGDKANRGAVFLATSLKAEQPPQGGDNELTDFSVTKLADCQN